MYFASSQATPQDFLAPPSTLSQLSPSPTAVAPNPPRHSYAVDPADEYRDEVVPQDEQYPGYFQAVDPFDHRHVPYSY